MSTVSEYRPGGLTAVFSRTPYYPGFIKQFRYEEQTALWNRGLGEADIIAGLAEATRINKAQVAEELASGHPRPGIRFAAQVWASTRWNRKLPAYYPSVYRYMKNVHTAEGRVAGHSLSKLIDLGAPASYIEQGLAQGFSWQQLIFGSENDLPLEYLREVVTPKEDEAEDD